MHKFLVDSLRATHQIAVDTAVGDNSTTLAYTHPSPALFTLFSTASPIEFTTVTGALYTHSTGPINKTNKYSRKEL